MDCRKFVNLRSEASQIISSSGVIPEQLDVSLLVIKLIVGGVSFRIWLDERNRFS